jgi:hypothetical protein
MLPPARSPVRSTTTVARRSGARVRAARRVASSSTRFARRLTASATTTTDAQDAINRPATASSPKPANSTV